ncbi:hypothetical protein Asi02nite_80570 [Asanoa siamensis]|uniref:Uncharacterized protein n=1 Tax=Asanoa siamensis TaxID=926357 RepID=A0ABQ4D4S4_9ACTN|nr:hypothetical protein Asi02nite_80570 [Asanoa siamensis]
MAAPPTHIRLKTSQTEANADAERNRLIAAVAAWRCRPEPLHFDPALIQAAMRGAVPTPVLGTTVSANRVSTVTARITADRGRAIRMPATPVGGGAGIRPDDGGGTRLAPPRPAAAIKVRTSTGSKETSGAVHEHWG